MDKAMGDLAPLTPCQAALDRAEHCGAIAAEDGNGNDASGEKKGGN